MTCNLDSGQEEYDRRNIHCSADAGEVFGQEEGSLDGIRGFGEGV